MNGMSAAISRATAIAISRFHWLRPPVPCFAIDPLLSYQSFLQGHMSTSHFSSTGSKSMAAQVLESFAQLDCLGLTALFVSKSINAFPSFARIAFFQLFIC